MDQSLAIETLGSLRIRRGEDSLAQLPLKAQALLVYLTVTSRPHSRPSLAALLWGGMPEERARANLRLALTAVRQEAGDILLATRQDVRLAPEESVWCDAVELTRFTADPGPHRMDERRSAVALYEDDFLVDLVLPDTPEFEEWVVVERERLQRAALTAALELVDCLTSRNELDESKQVLQKWLSITPWSEETHRRMIKILARSGERSLALAQYEQCRRTLEDEFGVEPDELTKALHEELRTGKLGSDTLSSPTDEASTPLQIPTPLTAFIGRQPELDELDRLLHPDGPRLVTLLGPGGSGKSRLALAALERIGERFPDGTIFVPLAGASSGVDNEAASLIVNGTARALGFRFVAHQPPQEALGARLADSTMLIVLDNFEELVSGAESLVWLLERASNLTIMTTSRERLGVFGEHIVDVTGLPYPVDGSDNPLEYAAVQLFVSRAREVRPVLDITSSMSKIVEICRRVDGHPLAIELAASWVRTLEVSDIAERVGQDPGLLASDRPGIPERHRSIHSILHQTIDLLDGESERLLHRLSVFRGGWDLAAAEKVAGARLQQLAGLLDRALISRDSRDRYDLHELVRQFAAAALDNVPNAQTSTRDAHAHYYTAYLQERRPLIESIPDRQAVAELDREAGNLHAAWEHLAASGMSPDIPEFVECYWLYLGRRGRHQDIVSLLSRALDLPGLTHIQQVRWLRWLGETHYQMGAAADAEKDLCDCLNMIDRTTLPDEGRIPVGLLRPAARQSMHRVFPSLPRQAPPEKRDLLVEGARALDRLGQLAFLRVEMNRALTATLQSLNFAERAGNTPDLARGYGTCALVCSMIPSRRLSRMYYRLAESSLERVDDPEARAYVLELLGLCSISSGEWDAASRHLDEAVELFGQMRLQRFWNETTGLRSRISYWTGELEHARELWDTVWQAGKRLGDPLAIQWGIVGVVEVSLRLGDQPPDQLLSLLGRTDPIEQFDAPEIACFHGARSASLLMTGDGDAALSTVRAGLDYLRNVKAPLSYSLPGYDLMLDTVVRLRSGERSTAGPSPELLAMTRMLEDFARIHPIGAPAFQRARGYVSLDEGRDDTAREAWQSGLRAAERLGMPFELAQAHLDLARFERGDLSAFHKRQARDILSRIGVADLESRLTLGSNSGSEVEATRS